MKLLPNITSLRFFLALLVILFHLPQFCSKHSIPFYNSMPIFNKGIEAVYAFFSLSGFLIIRQLYIEKDTSKTIHLKKFFLRRIYRIVPLYLLILTFGFLYYNLILPYFGFTIERNYNLIEGVLLCLFFMPNIFTNLYHPGGIIEILWSIGIEEQFYLFIAPIMFFLPSKRMIIFLTLFTFIYFILFFSDIFLYFRQFDMFFFYFSSGGIGSILALKNEQKIKSKYVTYLLVTLLLLYFSTNLFSNNFTNQNYHLISFLLLTISITYLAYNKTNFLSNPFLNYLGKISYGIYMYHAIVIQFIGYIYLKYFSHYNFHEYFIIILFNLIVVFITTVLAHFSYNYFETYFITLKKKISNR